MIAVALGPKPEERWLEVLYAFVGIVLGLLEWPRLSKSWCSDDFPLLFGYIFEPVPPDTLGEVKLDISQFWRVSCRRRPIACNFVVSVRRKDEPRSSTTWAVASVEFVF